jgi:hypothetical protein
VFDMCGSTNENLTFGTSGITVRNHRDEVATIRIKLIALLTSEKRKIKRQTKTGGGFGHIPWTPRGGSTTPLALFFKKKDKKTKTKNAATLLVPKGWPTLPWHFGGGKATLSWGGDFGHPLGSMGVARYPLGVPTPLGTKGGSATLKGAEGGGQATWLSHPPFFVIFF